MKRIFTTGKRRLHFVADEVSILMNFVVRLQDFPDLRSSLISYLVRMGFMSKGADKARERQRDAIIEEAGRSGATVLAVASLGESPTTSGSLGSIAKAFVGGSTSVDDAQVFTFATQGFNHTFMQPYDGMNPLPGLHSATLAGSVPFSVILKATRLGRAKWFDQNDEAVEALNTNAVIDAAANALSWKWKMGTTEIKLAWTVQFRPSVNGTTDVALRSGRYSGVMTYGVGVAEFLRLCGAIHALTSPAHVSPQPFVIPIGY